MCIRDRENSIKSGWKNNKWYPHKSAEGGNKTIAYGHKLKAGEDFSKGITDTQALQLLTKDLDTAKANAKIHIDNLHGAGTFDKLDVKRQEMLTGFQFNLGTLNTFSNFVKAVVKNDKKGMKKEYLRYYKNPETKKMMQVKDRNVQFYKRYLSS